MADLLAAASDAGSAPVGASRSGVPEPWELPLLAELGELLRDARLASGVGWPELEAVAGLRGSLRSVERGITRTRASRLRPWLELLGLDPEPVIARFAPVIAPEAADGRPRFRTVAPRPPAAEPPPLPEWAAAALGAELWRLRELAGLTRSALAESIECSDEAVRLVELGQRRPTVQLLESWLRAVRVDPADRTLMAIRFPSLISGRARAGSAKRPRVSPRARQPREGGHP